MPITCALVGAVLGAGCGAPVSQDEPRPGTLVSALSKTVNVSGRLYYNDLRKIGRFEWRTDTSGASGTQHYYGYGHRSNQLGLLDATVAIYEVDTSIGSGCASTDLMGSTTVGADGAFSWTGTVSDACAEGLGALKISLRYCDSAGTRCFSVREFGPDRGGRIRSIEPEVRNSV
jgi:hypothetical protein